MRTHVILVGLALFVSSTPTRAQPLFGTASSVETIVRDSSVIVRGVITGLATEQAPIPTNSFVTWYVVTLRVDQTLKGEHQQTIQFMMMETTSADGPAVAALKDENRDLLVFLKESRTVAARRPVWSAPYERFPLAPWSGFREESLIELRADAVPILFSMEPKQLKGTEAILAVTRAAIAFQPTHPPGEEYRFTLPWPIVAGSYWGERYNGGTSLCVPVDSRLEAKAKEWIESQDRAMREAGAAALGHFRSDENVQTLRRLLNDSASGVRRAAEKALRDWGYVPGPATPTTTIRP